MFGVSFAIFRNSERQVGQPDDTNINKDGLLDLLIFVNVTSLDSAFDTSAVTSVSVEVVLELVVSSVLEQAIYEIVKTVMNDITEYFISLSIIIF